MLKHDICFVGLKCYDLLTGAAVPRYLGGIERLLICMARGLTAKGIKVAFVTYDHGQPDGELVDGITIYNCYSTEDGLPALRFIHPRMTKLWWAMRRADAAVYLQMGAGTETGIVALGCQYFTKSKRPFVYSIASDEDVDADKLKRRPRRERSLLVYGLQFAKLLISQTAKQQKMLKNSLGFDSIVLALPIEAPEGVDVSEKAKSNPEQHHVLWIGRIVETKRLEFLFDVAKRCPDVIFDVVGTPNKQSAYYDNLSAQAEDMPNVILHARVAEGILPRLYQKTSLLACTSVLEGFPTTFLEAWSYGVPVVTTFDPDNIVANNGLGQVVQDADEMITVVNKMLGSRKIWQSAAQTAFDYFNKHYTLDAILPKFEKHCAALVDTPSGFASDVEIG